MGGNEGGAYARARQEAARRASVLCVVRDGRDDSALSVPECSRRTASCACVMFEALACCEHTLDIECCQTRVEAKPARSAREGCVGAWYDRDPTSAWSPFPRTPFVRMKPRGPPAVVPVSTRRAVLSERRAVQMGKCRGMCSSYRWVETQGLGA